MEIDEMTIGDFKKISQLLNKADNSTINCHIGKKVIIRTYCAGVHFGTLVKKSGKEVILDESRRLYFWKCKKSISLSGVAKYGVDEEESKICAPLDGLWLEAIEIIPLSDAAIDSIEGCAIVEPK